MKKKDPSEKLKELLEEHNLVIKAQAVPVDTTSQGQVIIGCQLQVDYKEEKE